MQSDFNSPGIKRFPVDERGVVVVAHEIPFLRLPAADFGGEGFVHDYISQHGTGVALHRGGPRTEEDRDEAAAGKHPDALGTTWRSSD